jgi:NADPH2:quinone reductase
LDGTSEVAGVAGRRAELGAHEVVVGLDGIDRPVDLVLDTVGGPQLAVAWELLAPGGGVQNIGPDLAALLDFVAAGRLSPEVGRRGSWEQITEAARPLLDRRIPGKAVLDVQPTGHN